VNVTQENILLSKVQTNLPTAGAIMIAMATNPKKPPWAQFAAFGTDAFVVLTRMLVAVTPTPSFG
jgi:hypothetical protein